MEVKPTTSLKNIVTLSKLSAITYIAANDNEYKTLLNENFV